VQVHDSSLRAWLLRGVVELRHLELCLFVFQSVPFQQLLWGCLFVGVRPLRVQRLWRMQADLRLETLISSSKFRRVRRTFEILSLSRRDAAPSEVKFRYYLELGKKMHERIPS
jgi:hypothetical protein